MTKRADILSNVPGYAGKGNEPGRTADIPQTGTMSASMRNVFLQLAMTEARYPDVTTVPAAEGRRLFELKHERWNRIDPQRFAIVPFEIPPTPLSAPARGPIQAVRVQETGTEEKGTLFYLHGGGWTFGSTESFIGIMSKLAERTHCTVIGIEYALAPEFPFPCGLDDCLWAWRWLTREDSSGRPWFVAGDSSGANLALSMMIDLRAAKQPLPQGAALVYGVYCGESGSESQRLFGQGQFGLTTERMAWFLNNYVPGGVAETARARLFPIEAELNDLPPLLIVAAELDPLRDDSIKLAEKLRRSNTPVEFKQVPGVIHSFLHWSDVLPEAATTLDDMALFLRLHGQP